MTLLELLLPEGRAAGALVLGSGCPPRLRPATSLTAPADLVLVVPTPQELAQDGWLEQAVATGSRQLAPDGLAYVVVPARRRRRARRLLYGNGLRAQDAMLHLPDVARSEHVVPVARVPMRHACRHVVPLLAWKRAAAGLLLGLGGGRLLAASAPPVALVARRRDARPLLGWLSALIGAGEAGVRWPVIAASWRTGGPRVIVHPLPPAGAPVVVKLARRGGRGLAAEAERLTRLGSGARGAGADVPLALRSGRVGDWDVLVQTRLEGDLLAPLLMRDPARLNRSLAAVCAWLEGWGARTAVRTPLTAALLDREVLRPAAALAPQLDGGADYLAHLRRLCAGAVGTTAPLTASHNDLTMWNVLVGGASPVGIVDWEVAQESTLPMRDFPYAVVDALAATRGYRDRPGAARAAFDPGGEHAAAVAALRRRQLRALDVAPGIAELSFHACWIGHALNEQAAAGGTLPFRAIVQRLARRAADRPAAER